ncbi:fasciclin domain-containing protein [Butyricimonas synergistica]|uniref:fasciclin domain-containing protein n=1 Tax=Butyricimonas synergistica TaxID=544644 RepID=UPI00036CBA90|nr:fasciclin domain-containing protein [Butyricimonas synergistica]
MKRNFYTLIAMLTCVGLVMGCTKDNFIATGVSDGRHDCSLLEYMMKHSYDWDSTVVMVRHAELTSLFENNELDGHKYEGLTFFGPTNHSIRRYLMEQKKAQVTDLDPNMCRTLLLRCMIGKKYYMDDFKAGEHTTGYVIVGEGGDRYTTLAGTECWIYTVAANYNGVPYMGAKSIYIKMLDVINQNKMEIASGNIEPNGCVVHALEYKFTIDDWLKRGETLIKK